MRSQRFADEISKICHKEGEPVYITKNGKGDLVVMSITRYEKQEALLELYQKLSIDIFEYIKDDNPDAAANFIERIDKAVSKLESFSLLGTIPKDERLQMFGYRMLVIGKYLAFYVIKDNIIEIRRIIHGSRKYSFLL
jgi:plasmid stabilization system protein ParE